MLYYLKIMLPNWILCKFWKRSKYVIIEEIKNRTLMKRFIKNKYVIKAYMHTCIELTKKYAKRCDIYSERRRLRKYDIPYWWLMNITIQITFEGINLDHLKFREQVYFLL